MKKHNIFSALLAPAIALSLLVGCEKTEEESIIYELSDVSDRVSGFSSDLTGPGAALTANGTELNNVVRVCIGNSCVPSKLFTNVSESSITFSVPSGVALGNNSQVMFVFPGSERAFKTINVVALPSISAFVPTSASVGETITVIGQNFDIVTGVRVGAVNATIASKTGSVIKFAVPDGAATGKVILVSAAGTATSATDLSSCTGITSGDCNPGLNSNSGFETGAGDNFDNWNKFNGGAKIVATTSVDANEVFRGTRALKVVRDGTITPGTDQWRIQLASDFVPLENGASYTVSAWVRAAVAGGAFRFSNQDAAQYGPDTAIPVSWTKISWTFTANAAQKRIVLDMNGAPVTTFFIDDVKITKN